MAAEEKRMVPLAPLVGIVADMQTEEIFRPIVEVIHFMTGRAELLSEICLRKCGVSARKS